MQKGHIHEQNQNNFWHKHSQPISSFAYSISFSLSRSLPIYVCIRLYSLCTRSERPFMSFLFQPKMQFGVTHVCLMLNAVSLENYFLFENHILFIKCNRCIVHMENAQSPAEWERERESKKGGDRGNHTQSESEQCILCNCIDEVSVKPEKKLHILYSNTVCMLRFILLCLYVLRTVS